MRSTRKIVVFSLNCTKSFARTSIHPNNASIAEEDGYKFACFKPVQRPGRKSSTADRCVWRRRQIDGRTFWVDSLQVQRCVYAVFRGLTMRRNRFIDLHRRLVASPGRSLENARQRFRRIEGILRVLDRRRCYAAAIASGRMSAEKSSEQSQQSGQK